MTKSEPSLWPIAMMRPLKINWASGKHYSKGPGWVNIDIVAHEHVDVVANLTKPFKLPNNCVDESYSANFLEHLTPRELIDFLNEIHRIHKPVTDFTFIVPFFDARNRQCWLASLSDPTHANIFTVKTVNYFNCKTKEWRKLGRYYRGNRSIGIPRFELISQNKFQEEPLLKIVLRVLK